MSKQRTQFGEYTIQTANTIESIALHKKNIWFNKLWIYPGARQSTGKLSANVGDVYLGEDGDGPKTTPDVLTNDDLPFKIELPVGEQKKLEEVLIQGAAGDSVWYKYWLPLVTFLALLFSFSSQAQERELKSSSYGRKFLQSEPADTTFNARFYISSATNGGWAIQQAINAASNAGPTRVVYVPKVGPDTASNVWLLTQPIILPSDTTLQVDGYIRLAPNTTNNLVRNASALSGDATRDHDITITGTGTFDGAPEEQNIFYLTQWKSHGFVFYKVDRLRVEGVRIRATSYGICPENVSDARFLNLDFLQIGNLNQACIQGFGPMTNVIIDGMTGESRDDCVAICAGGGTLDHLGRVTGQGPGGNVRHVVVRNVNVKLDGNAGIRTMGISNSVFTLEDVRFENCHFTGDAFDLIKIGWTAPITTNGIGGQTNISFVNVTGNATNNFVSYETPADSVSLINCSGTCGVNFVNYSGNSVPRYDLTIDGCDVTSTGTNKTWVDARYNYGRITIRNSIARSTGGQGQAIYFPLLNLGGNYHVQLINDGFAADAFLNSTPTVSNVCRLNITHLNGTNAWTGTFPRAGVIYNGVAWETANAETPQRTNYNAGDFVNFTDSGDASGSGFYLKLPDTTWKKL